MINQSIDRYKEDQVEFNKRSRSLKLLHTKKCDPNSYESFLESVKIGFKNLKGEFGRIEFIF
ncbi:hypothetical protein CH380_17630 [Leptospira adleri]|uniref:Uncharacterized protein n=1 Tax=Leptospira adleri TaxID=2023186 RepID=A0A2M9YK17_9LEPT|nr:hypothetical protein CH380_17630 [Leptospira adleri]PJZ60172.1 hypothetical protein CH376_19845 [Leptospira adleri]